MFIRGLYNLKKESKIKISSTYAKVWYEISIKEKELEKAFVDSTKLGSSFTSDDVEKISSPILSNALKIQIIDEISKKLNLSKSTASFLKVLVDNKRFIYLNYIIKDFKSMYYNSKGVTEVFVHTVKPLSSSQNDKLKNNLEKFLAKEVALTYDIRADLIGGLKIMYDTYEIDDSIKGKLGYLESMMKGSE